ncbi:minor extracellular protease vpr [Babesia caballi]|uniref:Minor extracellular protease vpr n=1 Tax=Babesia caballi TaxID=5871 RepID=A0AAV4LWQ2_BABCB|nr:minor extracellular protease vpr [Babesia caballi]
MIPTSKALRLQILLVDRALMQSVNRESSSCELPPVAGAGWLEARLDALAASDASAASTEAPALSASRKRFFALSLCVGASMAGWRRLRYKRDARRPAAAAAAGGNPGLARRFGHSEAHEALGISRVDANGVVKVLLLCAQADGETHALHDLAGVGADEVHADDGAVLLANQFRQAARRHVDVHLVGAHGLDLLAVDGRVLEGSELRKNGGCTYLLVTVAEDASSEHLTVFEGHRREGRHALHDVSDGVDVLHVGLAVDGHDAAGLAQLHAQGLQVLKGAVGDAASGVHYRVVLRRAAVSEGHLELAAVELGYGGGQDAAHEFRANGLHQLLHLFHALAVETTQQNGPHSHSDVEAHAGEEAGALERDIGSPHDECFARRVLEAHEVVGGYGILIGALDLLRD